MAKISNPFLQDDIYPLLSDVGFVEVFALKKTENGLVSGVRFFPDFRVKGETLLGF
ncbi:MAG: hypothetical protein R2875_11475 [Desulfobacterales bacterium]